MSKASFRRDFEIWDKGMYEFLSRSDKKIVIELHGKKLKGKCTLIQFGKDERNWTLAQGLVTYRLR